MKWRSSYLTELQKSLRPGAKAELVTARKMFGNRKSIGLGTIASYRMDPKQRMQRVHYAMACAKWGTLSDADKLAYATWADDNKVTVFSSFLHSYLSELKEDLVLYLPMDKITGTTVKDYSKYGNDGTETDGTITKDGFIDNAIDFNGTTSVVNCGHNTSLDITDAITLSLWLNASGFPTAYAEELIKMPHASAGTPYEIYMGSTGQLRFGAGFGGAWSSVTVGMLPSLDAWYNVAVTYNSARIFAYINGIETLDTAKTGVLPVNAQNLQIGQSTNARAYEGSIDEVRIYKKVLTAEEIRAMYVQESKWHGDVA